MKGWMGGWDTVLFLKKKKKKKSCWPQALSTTCTGLWCHLCISLSSAIKAACPYLAAFTLPIPWGYGNLATRASQKLNADREIRYLVPLCIWEQNLCQELASLCLGPSGSDCLRSRPGLSIGDVFSRQQWKCGQAWYAQRCGPAQCPLRCPARSGDCGRIGGLQNARLNSKEKAKGGKIMETSKKNCLSAIRWGSSWWSEESSRTLPKPPGNKQDDLRMMMAKICDSREDRDRYRQLSGKCKIRCLPTEGVPLDWSEGTGILWWFAAWVLPLCSRPHSFLR